MPQTLAGYKTSYLGLYVPQIKSKQEGSPSCLRLLNLLLSLFTDSVNPLSGKLASSLTSYICLSIATYIVDDHRTGQTVRENIKIQEHEKPVATIPGTTKFRQVSIPLQFSLGSYLDYYIHKYLGKLEFIFLFTIPWVALG